jgi:hypothetical protein
MKLHTDSKREIESEGQTAKVDQREWQAFLRNEVLYVVYRTNQHRKPESKSAHASIELKETLPKHNQ